MMSEPHFQPDPRLPGFGLGFFRVDLGGHLVIEHRGVLPGFDSQIFLAPHDGLAVLAFTRSKQATPWLPVETEELLGSLVGALAAVIRTDVAHHPESWKELCGGTGRVHSARACRPGQWPVPAPRCSCVVAGRC